MKAQEKEKQEKKKRELNILQGPMSGSLILFALPLALSSILQQFFNSADVAVVGNFAGSLQLAAVGANVANVGIFVNFIVGASIGPNVLIAHLIGQNRREDVHRTVQTAMSFAVVLGLILMAVGQILASPLLTATGTPAEVMGMAEQYLRIYLLGVPFMVVYNFGAAILRSKGETRLPLLCMVISGLLNVVLNLILVIVYHLDVAGVAIATSVSNALSAGIVVWYLLRRTDEMTRLDWLSGKWQMDGKLVKKIIQVGFPAGIQSMVFSVANAFIQSGINSFGAAAIAGSSAALNFEYFAYDISVAFAQAAVTFYSQNYGAGNLKRCRESLIKSLLLGIAFAEGLSLFFMIRPGFFLRFYTSDPAVAAFAKERMLYVLTLEGFTATYEVMAGVLRSRGWYLTPSVLSIIGTVVFRVFWLVAVFPHFHTFGGLMTVYPISWFFTFFMLLAAYRVSLKKPASDPNKIGQI